MKGILKNIRIGHGLLGAAIALLLILGLKWWSAGFWFGLFAFVYTIYSLHYLSQWANLEENEKDVLAALLSGLRVKRNLELVLIVSGLCFGLFSIWLPLGLAIAGVIVSGCIALHLVMTLILEWEVGIHHDKGV